MALFLLDGKVCGVVLGEGMDAGGWGEIGQGVCYVEGFADGVDSSYG